MEITDKKAEELEAKGMWRRAAARWLEVMNDAMTDSQREYIARRRTACLENVKQPPRKLDKFWDVKNAADRTLNDMGAQVTRDDYRTWTMKNYGRKQNKKTA